MPHLTHFCPTLALMDVTESDAAFWTGFSILYTVLRTSSLLLLCLLIFADLLATISHFILLFFHPSNATGPFGSFITAPLTISCLPLVGIILG